ncbi:MAG TPA: hypothetical protein VGF86_11955 [Candidatus Tumulicola sp.]|jgi:hypothetical protein
MASPNGEAPGEPLELREVLEFQNDDGATMEFEVKAILEDTDSGLSYAVLERDLADGDEGEVVVTDLYGNLVEDEDLVADILENYDVFVEEANDDGGGKA